MNAISAITTGLKSENVEKQVQHTPARKEVRAGAETESSSFLSILNLLDADGDEAINTQEVKNGLEVFITQFVSERDVDQDQALGVQEAGINPAVFNHLDGDADGLLETAEILSEADRILDGLFSVLDTDGDQLLTRQELAILELIFGSGSLLASQSDPGSETVFTRRLTAEGEILELDMNTLPERMRQAGFQGSDNALYYALAHVYRYGPEAELPDDGAGSLAGLNTRRREIYEWFDGEMEKVRSILKADPRATVTAIVHDGRDRCGFRLGPAIMERLSSFGDRVRLGEVFPEDNC